MQHLQNVYPSRGQDIEETFEVSAIATCSVDDTRL